MKIEFSTRVVKWAWIVGLIIVAVGGVATSGRWLPAMRSWVNETIVSFRGTGNVEESDAHAEDAHAGHDHAAHAGHAEETSLELSAQALRNIGLTEDMIRPVKLETFRRSITVPAVVVERPGRTRVEVATPMTGVVTHVHVVQGEAVDPGTLLFQIRLTHEDLVNAQTEFVKTLGELEVEEREITRLKDVTRSGAVPGSKLLERLYARDKLVVLLRAQREALKLHGLSAEQVKQIERERRLLRELQIFAPSASQHKESELKLTGSPFRPSHYRRRTVGLNDSTPLILQELNVFHGQSVAAGDSLCVLTDYSELYIEGLAFEQDISALRRASQNEWTVDGMFQLPDSKVHVVRGLRIAYLSNNVDPESRTLRFYVHLPNEISKDRREDGNRYVEWKYLPGQRLQLRVPVEEWKDQIVLPVDAVAQEGAETYVFQQNGNHFDRVAVHVKYQDQFSAVIENDGSLFPGDVVALKGAHQMQMALRNKAGGGVDPHAGHNH